MALEYCVMGLAYEITLVFQGNYELKDVGDVRKLLGKWCASVQAMRKQTGKLFEPMV